MFVDRTCRWIHRPELIGVPMLFVSTTSASGLKDTFRYLETIAIQWRAFPTDRIFRNVKTMNKEINENGLIRNIVNKDALIKIAHKRALECEK